MIRAVVLLVLLLCSSARANELRGGDFRGGDFGSGGSRGAALPSWSGSMIAWWTLDGTGTRTQSGGTCGSGADLTESATVPRSTTDFVEGTASADFTGGTSAKLNCTNANCGCLARNGSSDHSLTWGCWHKSTATQWKPIWKDSAGFTGFYLQVYTTSMACVIDLVQTSTAVDTPTLPWTHSVCVFDDTANTLTPYANGVAGSSMSVSSMTETTVDFAVNGSAATPSGQGYADECLVYSGTMAATSVCRICSCGIDGTMCTRNGTAYVERGRNVTECGSCTLPNADQATP